VFRESFELLPLVTQANQMISFPSKKERKRKKRKKEERIIERRYKVWIKKMALVPCQTTKDYICIDIEKSYKIQ